jgi:3-hydroxymyristoyl/3-hydroxydecanoyl-(acyl carrier protein) dehydratase
MTEPISLTIDPAHPSLAGHFPGDPIVPGAILLDYAIGHIERSFSRKVATILAAKFHVPVRPLQTVTFRVARGDKDRVTVTASVGSTIVCSLSVALGGGV